MDISEVLVILWILAMLYPFVRDILERRRLEKEMDKSRTNQL